MNIGIVDSELNSNFRLFCKTVSKSANWGFDRFRCYSPKWHTLIQVRRPNGTVVDTQEFSSTNNFEHDFSFDLSENINNDEYSVYIAGVPASAQFNQAYAYPTGYSATTGKNAELTYWDFSEVNIVQSGASEGRIRFENNPITSLGGVLLLEAIEVNVSNCNLDAETLADMLIGLDNSEKTDGTFIYSGNSEPPAERAQGAWDSLSAKNWTLTGDEPGASAGYHPLYQAKLDYAVANSIPTPSTQASHDFYNQRITDFDTNGGVAKSDVILDLGGDADPAFRLICYKRLVQCLAYGGLVWSSTGVEGNGTNAYIDPLFIPSTDGVNYTLNNSGAFWIAKKGVKDNGVIWGAQTGAGGGGIVRFRPQNTGSTSIVDLHASASTSTNNFTQIGANSHNRVDGSNCIIKGAADYPFGSVVNTNLPTNSLYILAGDNGAGGNSPYGYSTEQLGFFGIGADYSGVHDAVAIGL